MIAATAAGLPAAAPVLAAVGIVKEFPGVRALDGVDLSLHAGQVHALLGENGAGKSTLMKVLSGEHAPDEGELLLDGAPIAWDGPHAAIAGGVAMIHQELALVGPLTVAQNIALGSEPHRRGGLPFTIDSQRMEAQAAAALARLGSRIDPHRQLSTLGVAHQQLVEIARALAQNARVLIMDEPTASLSAAEAAALISVIGELKAAGVAIAFISHRLDDIAAIADCITVLRDGRSVWTGPRAGSSTQTLIRAMVGRELTEQYPPRVPRAPASGSAPADTSSEASATAAGQAGTAREVLRVEGLTREGVVQDVSFALREGEVVGLAGLIGAGRTELARLLAGADRPDRGRILLDNLPLELPSPRAAIHAGIAYLSEDRKADGLVLTLGVTENVNLTATTRTSALAPLDRKGMRDAAGRYVSNLAIKTRSLDTRVGTLSGGTQQKVLLARCLTASPRVVIFDEPTRGIDVGARVEIYEQINALARAGKAVLLISSDLPEVLGMSDRVLVMCDGRLTAQLERAEATAERVMAAALPGERNERVGG